jgi:hypothetical protein
MSEIPPQYFKVENPLPLALRVQSETLKEEVKDTLITDTSIEDFSGLFPRAQKCSGELSHGIRIDLQVIVEYGYRLGVFHNKAFHLLRVGQGSQHGETPTHGVAHETYRFV